LKHPNNRVDLRESSRYLVKPCIYLAPVVARAPKAPSLFSLSKAAIIRSEVRFSVPSALLYEFPQEGGKIVAVKLVNLENRSNNRIAGQDF
jgi:hypothetical protein